MGSAKVKIFILILIFKSTFEIKMLIKSESFGGDKEK